MHIILDDPDRAYIWTVRGNVPVKTLRYENHWFVQSGYVVFEERWWFEDGVLARNNIHKCHRDQLNLTALLSNDITVGLNGSGLGGATGHLT